MSHLPYFKYHTDPLKTGSIEKRETICPVCNEKREYVYVGPFYSRSEVEDICPWCIANGKAADKYDGTFQDHGEVEGITINPDTHGNEVIEELIKRTPGYYGIQQEKWLSHCNEPCNYLGQVGWKEIREMGIDVEEDIEIEAKKYRLSKEEFCKGLINKGFMQGYLFQCIHCGKYRLTSDID